MKEKIAFIWGVAEATLFFIVPDVWISFVALEGGKAWLKSVLMAGFGALIGGGAMYVWGKLDPSSVLRAIEYTPPVSWSMINDVQDQIARMGPLAMFIGAFTGRPYKVYAAMSGVLGIDPFVFILISYPARLLRFLLVGYAVHVSVKALGHKIPYAVRIAIHLVGWTVFYVWFFHIMRG